jgi:SAM-dependent methyltransferase
MAALRSATTRSSCIAASIRSSVALMAELAHSERYFTDARDHWWHADHVALLARRFGLGHAKEVLDVGTGQGHFARVWAPHFAQGFRLTGVDRETRSLAFARERCSAFAAERKIDGRFDFLVADASKLPFEDDCFDLVMAQTLLIHVADPEAVFAEFVRVTRPGGLVLCAEPNNLAGLQPLAAWGPNLPTERTLPALRLLHRCTRGKHALGLGWNHVGAVLPRLFGGLLDVQAYNNDRAWQLSPPYASSQERAAIDDLRRDVLENTFGWGREEAARYYVAGGGSLDDFSADYDELLALQREQLDQVDAGAWTELTAFAMLVVCGRKPKAAR